MGRKLASITGKKVDRLTGKHSKFRTFSLFTRAMKCKKYLLHPDSLKHEFALLTIFISSQRPSRTVVRGYGPLPLGIQG